MTVKPCNWPAVGATDREIRNLLTFFVHFNAHFACSVFFPGSAETDVGWGGNLNNRFITSCIKNTPTKNYWNLVIFLRVTVNNVGDVFRRFLFILTHILLVLHFPGSAEAEVGWAGKLKGHLMASCVGNTRIQIIKIWWSFFKLQSKMLGMIFGTQRDTGCSLLVAPNQGAYVLVSVEVCCLPVLQVLNA